MTSIRLFLELLASCLVYSLVVILVNIVLILVFVKDINQISIPLQLIILTEGGLGLLIGGAIGSNSATIGKIGEVIFHIKPRGTTQKKDIQNQAESWIVTGIILVFVALLLSAV